MINERTIGVILEVLIIAILITGCGKKKHTHAATMNIDIPPVQVGKNYKIYNGTEWRTFQVEDGETYEVKITTVKDKGKINIVIKDENGEGEPVYEGNDLPSTEFTVEVREKGNYVVIFEAEKFEGEFICEISKK